MLITRIYYNYQRVLLISEAIIVGAEIDRSSTAGLLEILQYERLTGE